MTVVIADTSPINYLILIDDIQILPRLYRHSATTIKMPGSCGVAVGLIGVWVIFVD